MDEVLNMPDFIEMESKNTILFWSHRYELLKKKYAVCFDQNNELGKMGRPKKRERIYHKYIKKVENCRNL